MAAEAAALSEQLGDLSLEGKKSGENGEDGDEEVWQRNDFESM